MATPAFNAHHLSGERRNFRKVGVDAHGKCPLLTEARASPYCQPSTGPSGYYGAPCRQSGRGP